MGPYGKFGENCLKHDKDMLWIAGGIGITPFLSLAKYESKHPSGRNIILIWVTKDKSTAFHDKELYAETKQNENFKYISWFSSKNGRLNISEIEKIINNNMELKNIKILMCGPPTMVYSISRELKKSGVTYNNIIFEDFNMLD